jgi:hypothetical protein
MIGIHRDVYRKGAGRRKRLAIVYDETVGERPDVLNPDRKLLGGAWAGEHADHHVFGEIHIRRGLIRMMLGPKRDPLMIVVDDHFTDVRNGRIVSHPFERRGRRRFG